MSRAIPDPATDPKCPADTRTAIATEMAALRVALDAQIPPKRDVDRNILIGTWNIRAFGGLTEDWKSGSKDSPKRNWRGMLAIAEIISRFDIVAVQEIKDDLKALRTLMKTLGPDWQFLITDENMGDGGNDERSGFLFDSRRARLSGLAGELSVPVDEKYRKGLTDDLSFRQFVRTPYAVSFQTGGETIILVTAHIIYGDGPEDRTAELAALGNWMADWATRSKRYGHNLMVLGDFNIDRKDDENYQAFTAGGLTPPDALNDAPRTIFPTTKNKFYDQITWFETGAHRKLNLEFIAAGGFDFSELLFQAAPKLTKSSMSWRVSDHLPLWAEFRARG